MAPVGINSYLEQLKKVEVPTLIIWGENDTVVHLNQADDLAEALKTSRKVILEGARHPCYLDKPEEFHRELGSFLQDISKGGMQDSK